MKEQNTNLISEEDIDGTNQSIQGITTEDELQGQSVNFISDYGTLSHSVIKVPYGTVYSTNGNKLIINDIVVTATPDAETAQYTYAFSHWSSTSGKITQPITIIANFCRNLKYCNVLFESANSEYGSVSHASISVPFGSVFSTDKDKLTINGETIMAIPAQTEEYDYDFLNWSFDTNVITNTVTIKANFTRKVRTYTVTFQSSNKEFGYTSHSSITVPYGTIYSADKTNLTIDGTTVRAIPKTQTPQYCFVFSNWSSSNGIIKENTTITANFVAEIRVYIISFVTSNPKYGFVSHNSMVVPYGTSFSSNGNILTVKETNITATPHAGKEEQYTCEFLNWSSSDGVITEPTIIIANFNWAPATLYQDIPSRTIGTRQLFLDSVPSGTIYVYATGDIIPGLPYKIQILVNNVHINTVYWTFEPDDEWIYQITF